MSRLINKVYIHMFNIIGKLMKKCGLLDEALNFFLEIIKIYPNNQRAFK